MCPTQRIAQKRFRYYLNICAFLTKFFYKWSRKRHSPVLQKYGMFRPIKYIIGTPNPIALFSNCFMQSQWYIFLNDTEVPKKSQEQWEIKWFRIQIACESNLSNIIKKISRLGEFQAYKIHCRLVKRGMDKFSGEFLPKTKEIQVSNHVLGYLHFSIHAKSVKWKHILLWTEKKFCQVYSIVLWHLKQS